MKKIIQVTSIVLLLLGFTTVVSVNQANATLCLIQDADPKPETETPQENQEPRRNRENNRSEDSNDENRVNSSARGLGRDANREHSKRSVEFVELFKPLVASAEESTVKVLNGDRMISLGTVVGHNGLVLTKASELRGDINCGFANGDKVPAVVVGIHPETDLALLKIERSDLNPVHWGPGEVPIVGQWLAAPVLSRTNSRDIHAGVVGVDVRKIPPSSPYLGIQGPQQPTPDIVGAKIDRVEPDTPADDADLMVGDVITKIEDVEIKNWDDLRRTLGQYDPKDEIRLSVLRGQEELKLKAVLGEREKLERRRGSQQPDRGTQQNNMGSQPSQRRKDFPMAFQHDLMLNKTTCGGPVVNLDGHVVGINIARAGRVDSLALPVHIVLPIVELLKSGELAPEKVNQVRLAKIEVELAEVSEKIEAIPETQSLDFKLQLEKARREEVEKSIAQMEKEMEELKSRLKVIDLKEEGYETQLKSIKSERNALDRRKMSLEREQKGLSTGVN